MDSRMNQHWQGELFRNNIICEMFKVGTSFQVRHTPNTLESRMFFRIFDRNDRELMVLMPSRGFWYHKILVRQRACKIIGTMTLKASLGSDGRADESRTRGRLNF